MDSTCSLDYGNIISYTVYKHVFSNIGCEIGRWIELAQSHVSVGFDIVVWSLITYKGTLSIETL